VFGRLSNFKHFPKPLWGDWLVIGFSLGLVILSFFTLWSQQPATTLRIRTGSTVFGEFSLMQTKSLKILGKIGVSAIDIQQGKVRFKQSPCNSQYCVHQGWLQHAGQVAICIPNQVSIELIGAVPTMDTLNY
jgi:hypothetical protein